MTEFDEFKEAIEQFEKSITINPQRANCHSNLGTALVRFGFGNLAVNKKKGLEELNKGRRSYYRALELDSTDIVTRKNLGMLLAYLGEVAYEKNDNDEARKCWQESLDHFEAVVRENIPIVSVRKDPLQENYSKEIAEAKKL